MEKEIKNMIEENININKMISDELSKKIEESINLIVKSLKNNKKMLLAGNGGSTSQASHVAAEFIGRFKLERKSLPCIALTTDTSILTSIGNDYGFDKIFERQVEGLGNQGDILITISTSGNSENLIKAVKKAKELNMKTISLLGKDGGKTKGLCDIELIVPSNNTPRIQESHIMILHIICELVEKELFSNETD
jgi:D-sedoheptulose 7-phosphate isomerase